MRKSVRLIKTLLILSIFAFGVAGIIGSSSGGGDDNNGDNNTPQTYTASGTYTYDSDTGVLAFTITNSNFTGCGPDVGDDTEDVESISETTMYWPENNMLWDRDSGTAGDITGTWHWIDEDGNSYEVNINADGSMLITAEIIDCDDIQDSVGSLGIWDVIMTIDLAGLDTNFDCIPGDSEGDETRDGTVNINQTGNTFSMITDDNQTFNGTISGGVYTFSGTWIEDNDDGADYTVTMSGSFTFPTPTTLVGNGSVSGSNIDGNFCEWDETYSGTKR